VTVVNEGWFQAQPAELREAIRAAGRAAEQRVYPWGVANVERTYRIWTEHGGVITELSEADQARMQKAFAELAERLVSADPAVAAEYRRIRALLAQRRGG